MHHVVMEHHLAVRQRADRLAVLADVRDHQDSRQDLVEARREELRRAADVSEVAEIRRDAQQVFLRQLLAAHDEHDMVEPDLVDEFDRRLVERLREVDAAHLRADVLRELDCVVAFCGDGGHAFLRTDLPESLAERPRCAQYACAFQPQSFALVSTPRIIGSFAPH